MLCAFVFPQIPDSDTSPSITSNHLTLIGMNHHIIDRHPMVVASLYAPVLGLPYLDPTVFGARHHPLPLAVEYHTRDVPRVTCKDHDGLWIGRSDVEKLDIVVSSCGEVAFIWGDAQAIDLRVRMLYGAGTDARESFPEADGVVVASCFQR